MFQYIKLIQLQLKYQFLYQKTVAASRLIVFLPAYGFEDAAQQICNQDTNITLWRKIFDKSVHPKRCWDWALSDQVSRDHVLSVTEWVASGLSAN